MKEKLRIERTGIYKHKLNGLGEETVKKTGSDGKKLSREQRRLPLGKEHWGKKNECFNSGICKMWYTLSTGCMHFSTTCQLNSGMEKIYSCIWSNPDMEQPHKFGQQ